MPPRGFGLCRPAPEKLRNALPTHWTFLSPELTRVSGQECAGFGCCLCWVGCPHKARVQEVLGTRFRRSHVEPQKIHCPITCEKPSVHHSRKYPLEAMGLHELENWEGQPCLPQQPSHLCSVEVWGKGDARNQPTPSIQSTAACIALSQCQIQNQCRLWPRTINKFICCRAELPGFISYHTFIYKGPECWQEMCSSPCHTKGKRTSSKGYNSLTHLTLCQQINHLLVAYNGSV